MKNYFLFLLLLIFIHPSIAQENLQLVKDIYQGYSINKDWYDLAGLYKGVLKGNNGFYFSIYKTSDQMTEVWFSDGKEFRIIKKNDGKNRISNCFPGSNGVDYLVDESGVLFSYKDGDWEKVIEAASLKRIHESSKLFEHGKDLYFYRSGYEEVYRQDKKIFYSELYKINYNSSDVSSYFVGHYASFAIVNDTIYFSDDYGLWQISSNKSIIQGAKSVSSYNGELYYIKKDTLIRYNVITKEEIRLLGGIDRIYSSNNHGLFFGSSKKIYRIQDHGPELIKEINEGNFSKVNSFGNSLILTRWTNSFYEIIVIDSETKNEIKTFRTGGNIAIEELSEDDLFFLDVNNGKSFIWKTDKSFSSIDTLRIIDGLPTGEKISLGKNIFFTVNNGTSFSVFGSDGTIHGTKSLFQFQDTIINSGKVVPLAALGSKKIFFTAYTPEAGEELWVTDGSDVNTKMVKDIAKGLESISISEFRTTSKYLFFLAMVKGVQELWRSDGTAEGTIRLYQNTCSGMSLGSVANDIVLFLMCNSTVSNNSVWKPNLWKTDGTVEGTELLKDIQNPLNTQSFKFLENINKEAIFTFGSTLWSSSGASEATNSFKDIESQTYIGESITFKDYIYFITNTPANERIIWKTDGTTLGTQRVFSLNQGKEFRPKSFLGELNSELYFIAADSNNSDNYIYKTKGVDTSYEIVSIMPKYSSKFTRGNSVNGKLVFGVDDFLYATDGTKEGTSAISNIYLPNGFTAYNDALYFFGNLGNRGSLLRTDGTTEGTIALSSKRLDPELPNRIISVDNNIYFALDTYEYGREIFKLGEFVNDINQVNHEQGGYTLFPNPANFYFSLNSTNREDKEINIRIITLEGLVLSNLFINPGAEVDISTLNPGLYIVEIQSEKNIIREKLLKK